MEERLYSKNGAGKSVFAFSNNGAGGSFSVEIMKRAKRLPEDADRRSGSEIFAPCAFNMPESRAGGFWLWKNNTHCAVFFVLEWQALVSAVPAILKCILIKSRMNQF